MRKTLFGALAGAALALSAVGAVAQDKPAATETAIFAGGCFWCVESDFDKVPGVLETVSGYAGGHTSNPTYEDVTAGGTGHREVVKIVYDPAKVSYPQLVSYFWRTVDPLDARGQFCDKGESYTTAIYATSPSQLAAANAGKETIEKVLGRPVATVVAPLKLSGFTAAEGYHQDYYQTNALKYKYYRWGCGRDARLEQLWGDAAGKWPPPADAPGS